MIERILLLIEQNKITARKLISDLELSSSSISEWKKGKAKPSLDATIKLAEYFNVSLNYLVYGIDEMPIHTLKLTKDESHLLNQYNSLSKDNKNRLRGYIDSLLGECNNDIVEDKGKLSS